MLGDRFFGLSGAVAAVAGMLVVPLVIVMALTARVRRVLAPRVVAGALRGMGAVAAGLIIATAIRLMATLGSNRLGRPLAAAFARPDLRHDRLAALAADLGRRRPRHDRGARSRYARTPMSAMLHPALSGADLLGLFAPFPRPQPARHRRRDHDRARHAPLRRRRAPLDQRCPVQRLDRDRPGGAGTERPVRRRHRLERRRADRRAGDDGRHAAAVDRADADRDALGPRRRDTRGVRAFTTGLTPLTIGLLVATGWVLARPYVDFSAQGVGAIA